MTAAQALAHYDLFLFDLDGTLITSYMDNSDANYHNWSFLRGRIETVQALRQERKTVGVVTNQAGVDFGYNDVSDWLTKRDKVSEFLGLSVEDYWVCYAHPNGVLHQKVTPDKLTRGGLTAKNEWDFGWRKPSPLMLLAATLHFDISPDRTVFVGDMETDEEAAKNAKIDYVHADQFFA